MQNFKQNFMISKIVYLHILIGHCYNMYLIEQQICHNIQSLYIFIVMSDTHKKILRIDIN